MADSAKDFSPQLAALSGYLLYIYPVTLDSRYRDQMERVMDVVLRKMRDPESGWVLDRFDRAWNPTRNSKTQLFDLNVGHNIEVAWLLLRLARITGNSEYLPVADSLARLLFAHGYEPHAGVWRHRFPLSDPAAHDGIVPWWVQAYGNMYQLYLFGMDGDPDALDRFRAGADFWNRNFLDREYGGEVLTTYLDGRIANGSKGVRTKTSYHAVEHSLLNYLYLNLWVADRPVELYFRVEDPSAVALLYPLPIEGGLAHITKVTINGQDWRDFDASGGVRLPATGPIEVKVTMASIGPPAPGGS